MIGGGAGCEVAPPDPPRPQHSQAKGQPELPTKPGLDELDQQRRRHSDGALSVSGITSVDPKLVRDSVRGVVRDHSPACPTPPPPKRRRATAPPPKIPQSIALCRKGVFVVISDHPNSPDELVLRGYDWSLQPLLKRGLTISASGQALPSEETFQVSPKKDALKVFDPRGQRILPAEPE